MTPASRSLSAATDRRRGDRGGRLLVRPRMPFRRRRRRRAALPEESLPEVAFPGRSNVGKSSLVNALTGRRMLARTSNTPGRTRQLNFFALERRADAGRPAGLRLCRGVENRDRRLDPPGAALLAAGAACAGSACWSMPATASRSRPPGHGAVRHCRAVSSDGADQDRQARAGGARRDSPGRSPPNWRRTPPRIPEIHLTSAEKHLGIAALRATLAGFAA